MTKIAILGAGYGGVHAAKSLAHQLKNDPNVEITLFDKNPFHTLMTELHEVAGGRAQPDELQIPLKDIFAKTNVTIQIGTVTSVDFDHKVIESDERRNSYDYLILGPGAESDYYGTKGAQENSFSLWSLADAIAIHQHLESQFIKASRQPQRSERLKTLAFVVAGAGFTGMEILGELLEQRRWFCRRYDLDEAEVSVTLIEAKAEILPVLPEALRKKALKYLVKRGAVVLLQNPIVEVRPDAVVLKSGRQIETETLIWTCGIKGTAFDAGRVPTQNAAESNQHFSIRKKCRLQTNSSMQSLDHEGVFIVGDVVWYSEQLRVLPQVVETALLTADIAAKNIVAEIRGHGEKAFRSDYHGFLITIGSRFAVGRVMGISLSGRFPVVLKHLVNLQYLWGVAGPKACFEYAKSHFMKKTYVKEPTLG